jgi:molybdopterin biosynthesis enzyme
VLDFLSRLVAPIEDTIALPLIEGLGRVLAEDVVSPFDVPPHDNSAMDGYAFDGRQLTPDAAPELQVADGTALAGKAWQGSVQAGECVKIMTGAIMPAGLDTVVPQELVSAPRRVHQHSARPAACRRQPPPARRRPGAGPARAAQRRNPHAGPPGPRRLAGPGHPARLAAAARGLLFHRR